MLARLWHSPSMDGAGSDAVGTACIGSSEAIMLGGECLCTALTVQLIWLIDLPGIGAGGSAVLGSEQLALTYFTPCCLEAAATAAAALCGRPIPLLLLQPSLL